jgi:hypothetical protein
MQGWKNKTWMQLKTLSRRKQLELQPHSLKGAG